MRRWATEDPNPQEIDLEAKRIHDLGQESISKMLDENLVEAAQTLRALEDGDEEDFYPIEPSVPEPEDDEDQRPLKRIRGNGETDGANGGGERIGIFSADAIDNIKFYAEMARKQREEAEAKTKGPAKGMALLGGYGSGDESD